MSKNAVAHRQDQVITAEEGGNPLVAFRVQLEQRAQEFKMGLPAHITPEKFQRTILTAVQSNPALLRADRRSLLTACMKAAQDGLLPDGREAALVTFKTRQKTSNGWQTVEMVQYMPMVFGLRKKILQSGEVKDIHAAVVYRQEIEAGLFIYEEGTERTLRHKPLLDPDFEPKDDDIVAAYSVATLNDGSMVFEVMRRADINKVREKSQTGARFDRDGKPREPSGPWVEWFSEMAKKSVVRRHSKMLPMSGDLIDVEAADDALYAASATATLSSVEPDEPAVLPTRGDIRTIEGHATEAPHDPETGEIHDASAAAEEAEADDDSGIQWDVWLESVDQALSQYDSVIDVNSYWSNLRPVLEKAPEGARNRAEALKQARIEEIRASA